MVSSTVVIITGGYLLVILAIGLYAARRVETGEDYMLAGRRLGLVYVAGTLAATEIGGGSSMGVAQQAYREWGLSAGWYVLSMAIAFVGLAFLAPRLRSTLTTTSSEFFKKRYGTGNHLITTIVLLLPMIGLTAVQIVASGIVLSITLGLSYQAAVLIMGGIVVIYSVVGGMWSVSMTDLIQWIFIIGGIAITVPFALNAIGGWDAMVNQLEPWRFNLTEGIGWKQILSLIVIYFTSFSVGQEYVQRYFAAESDSAAKGGAFLAAATFVVFAFLPAILGLAALTYQQQGHVIPYVAQYGSRYVLPGFATIALPDVLVGILFGALVSATMSSGAADLVAASTLIVNDLYEEYVNPDITQEALGQVNKIVSGIIGAAAIIIALLRVEVIVAVLLFSFAFRAAGLFVPYVGSHYWEKGSSYGSFLAIGTGSAIVTLGALDIISFGGWRPIIPAIIMSGIIFVLGSYFFPDEKAPSLADITPSTKPSSRETESPETD